MNWIKRNWQTMLPIGVVLTPFYMSLLRWSLRTNELDYSNGTLTVVTLILLIAMVFITVGKSI